MGIIKFLFMGRNLFHYTFFIWMGFIALPLSVAVIIMRDKIDWIDVSCLLLSVAGVFAFVSAWKEYKRR